MQVPGEGFGAWPHPTTLLCLDALDGIGAGAAIDLGCGSGLLSQAWATRHGQVVAVDLDPRAIAHARASFAHARPLHAISLRHAPIARVLVDATAQVLLANVPPIVHREIAHAVPATTRTMLVSGVRTGEAAPLLGEYRGLGFDVIAASEAAGWGCWVLERR